jgi:hypothetical protein
MLMGIDESGVWRTDERRGAQMWYGGCEKKEWLKDEKGLKLGVWDIYIWGWSVHI